MTLDVNANLISLAPILTAGALLMIRIGPRRRVTDQIQTATAALRIYLQSAVILALATLAAIVAVAIYVPNSGTIIAAMTGVTSLITLSLVMAGINSMGGAIDGRMTQLIDVKAEAERAKGVIEGLQKNPEIAIEPPVKEDE